MSSPASVPSSAPSSARVALLDRTDGALVADLVAYLDQLGTTAVVVADAPAGGHWADGLEGLRGADYAVLLLPADESAAARPEALLEVGYVLGAVGRKRVCVLSAGPLSLAPALKGVPSHSVDASALWRLLLAREMKQAGLDVDLNRAI